MKIFNAIVILSMLIPIAAHGQESKTNTAASGLWRLDWQDGRSGYLCVDEAHQPWRLVGDEDRLYNCWVDDSSWQESNGDRLRVTSEKTERQWREAGVHRMELSCVNKKFSSAHGDNPWSVATSVINRTWSGDYRSRLDFSEEGRADSTTGSIRNAVLPPEMLTGAHSMTRIADCPASVPAGYKCRIPTPESPATSEWPACYPTLTGQSRR